MEDRERMKSKGIEGPTGKKNEEEIHPLPLRKGYQYISLVDPFRPEEKEAIRKLIFVDGTGKNQDSIIDMWQRLKSITCWKENDKQNFVPHKKEDNRK